MDDPSVIAQRLGATAKDILDSARTIADEALQRSGAVNQVTAEDAVDTLTKTADLAFTGGIEILKSLLDEPVPGSADEGRRLVADAMEAIVRRMIRETGAVACEVTQQLENGPPTPTKWAQSLVKLADIAMLGGTELVETALIGPGPYERTPVTAGPFTVNTIDPINERSLTVTTLSRPGAADVVPKENVSFEVAGNTQPPGDGVLPAGQTQFTMYVKPTGLISGNYTGTVTAGPTASGAPVTAGSAEVDILL